MSPRQSRIERLVGVRRESQVAILAVDLLDQRLRTDPSFLKSRGLGSRVFRDLQANLDGTFLVRLFAEFESTLRGYWRDGLGLATILRTRDLIDAIGTRRIVGRDKIDTIHEVRCFRNSLVHDDHDVIATVPLEEAERRLCAFLARLPRTLGPNRTRRGETPR